MDNTELGGSACRTKLQYNYNKNAQKKFQLKFQYNRLSGTIDCKGEGTHNRLYGIIDCEGEGKFNRLSRIID